MNVTCIYCDQRIWVASNYSGKEIACPKCGKAFPLPSAAAAGSRGRRSGESREPWWKPGLSGVLSCVFHFFLLLICSLVTWGNYGGGGLGDEVLLGDLPSKQLTQTKDEQLTADSQKPVEQQTELKETFEEIAPPIPAADAEAIEIDSFLLTPSGSASDAAEMKVISGGGSGVGSGASFMGSHAQGQRFCIVADCSGSMAGPPVEHVKREVLETINSMNPRARFQIVFYSTDAIPCPTSGWLHPRRNKGDIEQWLSGIEGQGLTEPTKAFKLVFQFDPKPDAIFFMTDGQFDPKVVEEVATLNRDKNVVINTICFMDRSSEPMMRAIAKASGGRYRYVYVSGL